MKKIIFVVGARPNYMKIAPVLEIFRDSEEIIPVLVHTGQHYDDKMSELFFSELSIPRADIYLNIGSDTHTRQVARIMMAFEEVCKKENPHAVMVAGDVNSTMACALAAGKTGIKVIHLEAGLRSFDKTMPEEINRMVTDCLADVLLTPSEDANQNLLREGISSSKIHFVGNIMIDTLYRFLPQIEKNPIPEKLNLTGKQYVLVTLHRPANVDDRESLRKILETLNIIARKVKVVFPVHPRTLKNILEFNLKEYLDDLLVTDALGYFEFQKLMTKAALVITDSGGIQEETTVLGIPCITLRENTERPVTVTLGTNEVIGNDMEKLLFLTDIALKGKWKRGKVPELWDGKTAQRVKEVILKTI